MRLVNYPIGAKKLISAFGEHGFSIQLGNSEFRSGEEDVLVGNFGIQEINRVINKTEKDDGETLAFFQIEELFDSENYRVVKVRPSSDKVRILSYGCSYSPLFGSCGNGHAYYLFVIFEEGQGVIDVEIRGEGLQEKKRFQFFYFLPLPHLERG